MPLPIEPIPTIIGRGAVSIVFHLPDPDEPEDVQYGRLEVQVKRSDKTVVRSFDLLERLTDDAEGNDTHLPALNALKTYILARIDSEMFGL
jgi:hypothetical protein